MPKQNEIYLNKGKENDGIIVESRKVWPWMTVTSVNLYKELRNKEKKVSVHV